MAIKWMWADAAGPFHRIASNNPLRWSAGSLTQILNELLTEPSQRPVKLRVDGQHGSQVFEGPLETARWILENLVSLRVRFQVRCGTQPGEFLIVTGAPTELGAWDVLKGVRLRTTAEDYPIWTSDELSCVGLCNTFEYKYTVCSSITEPRWEEGPKRFATLMVALPDLGEPGTATIVDSSVGLTVQSPQIRFEPAVTGHLLSLPLTQQLAAPKAGTKHAEARSPELLTRAEWSCVADSRTGPGSFGAACFPQMVWDHRSSNDTAQLDDRLSLGASIGKGSFGEVLKGTLKQSGEQAIFRAVKRVRKSQIGNAADFNREIRMMELMDHQNVLRLFEVFEDHRFVYLVTELCEGGDMLEFMLTCRNDGCSEPEAAHLLRQMTAALKHCHHQSVAHRDVKLENFLIVERSTNAMDCRVKLCDMGLANRVPPSGFKKPCGSLTTLAPEILMVSAGGPRYGIPCDMWSLGSVLYSLLSCNIAQGPDIGSDWQTKLKSGRYDMKSRPWPSLSGDACDLVRSLMRLNVFERLTAEGCMQHPWLSQQGPNKSFSPDGLVSFGTAKEVSEGLNRWFGQCRLGHFRKTALHVLAQQGGASGKLREAFQSLDQDKDGQVSLRQLVDVLAQILPGGKDNALVREWCENILPVLPADAALGQTEFLAATMSAEAWLEEDRCWDVFRFFDRDRDGTISVEDLEQAFPEGKAAARRGFAEEVEALGGRITFARFVQLMRESVQTVPSYDGLSSKGGNADSGVGNAARETT